MLRGLREPPTPPESNGIPLTIYSGLEFRFIDPIPLISTFAPSPGAPPLFTMETPATLPCISCCGEKTSSVLRHHHNKQAVEHYNAAHI